MTDAQVAAAIAFFALGANLLAIALLLLFDFRNRAIRWYALFQADLLVWLGSQGWLLATGETGPVATGLFEGSVHMLPGLFVATALVECRDVRPRVAWAVVGLSAALLPLTLGNLVGQGQGTLSLAWQLFGWTTGIVLHRREGVHERMTTRSRRILRRIVLVFLGIGVPAMIVLGFLSGGQGFFVFAMPLVTVAIQVLIFVGVIHLRFYDLEVRSSRRGELAAGAAELQRKALVGEIAASFAHEVRNPLTGVRSLAQRLAEEDVDEPSRRRYAEVITREIGRVEQIVSNLLGFARRSDESAPGTGPTDLGPLFEDLAILVAARAEKAGVEVVPETVDLAVAATRETLAQSFLNLLLNAVEHSPRGGRVDLLARAEDGAAVIAVRDQGPGVAPAERERIFEPLYSGRGGSGLGLAVVRRVAEESGWRIEVADAPGGGAEFRVSVPLARSPRGAA